MVVVRGYLVAWRLLVVAIVVVVGCHGERAVPRALTPRRGRRRRRRRKKGGE
jgi:hypothetical protein